MILILLLDCEHVQLMQDLTLGLRVNESLMNLDRSKIYLVPISLKLKLDVLELPFISQSAPLELQRTMAFNCLDGCPRKVPKSVYCNTPSTGPQIESRKLMNRQPF